MNANVRWHSSKGSGAVRDGITASRELLAASDPMRSLRVCIRALSAVMLALLARAVIAGPSPAVVLTAALIALLLLVSGMLWQYGRRLELQARTLRTSPGDRREERNGAADRQGSSRTE
jgi:hypothetical protein